ncbi:MAG TPA: glycosyl hydrolase, partial [Actinomycetota bacterium]
LNRSTDYAADWKAISPDLTGGPGRDTQYPFGTITTVAAAKTNPKVLYVGTDDGRLWSTHDLGKTWVRALDPDLPKTWVTRVAVDPKKADVAYVTYSGFRAGNDQPYILRTKDGGKKWKNITGDLPQAPVNCVVIVKGRLYVATDVGVFSSKAGGSWARVGRGLPEAPIDDLQYQTRTHALFAATFGRGMYSIRV